MCGEAVGDLLGHLDKEHGIGFVSPTDADAALPPLQEPAPRPRPPPPTPPSPPSRFASPFSPFSQICKYELPFVLRRNTSNLV